MGLMGRRVRVGVTMGVGVGLMGRRVVRMLRMTGGSSAVVVVDFVHDGLGGTGSRRMRVAEDHDLEDHDVWGFLARVELQRRVPLVVCSVGICPVTQEHLEDGKVGVVGGQVGRGFAIETLDEKVGAIASQQVGAVVVSILRGVHDGGLSLVVPTVEVGLVAQERGEALVAPVGSGGHDRRHAFSVDHVPRSAFAQEEFERGRVAMQCRKGQRRFVLVVFHIEVALDVHQILEAGSATFASSEEHRTVPVFIANLDVGALGHEVLDSRQMSVKRCHQQRRTALCVAEVWVCLVIDQNLHALEVVIFSGIDERSLAALARIGNVEANVRRFQTVQYVEEHSLIPRNTAFPQVIDQMPIIGRHVIVAENCRVAPPMRPRFRLWLLQLDVGLAVAVAVAMAVAVAAVAMSVAVAVAVAVLVVKVDVYAIVLAVVAV